MVYNQPNVSPPLLPDLYWDGYLSSSQTIPPQGEKVRFSAPTSSPDNKEDVETAREEEGAEQMQVGLSFRALPGGWQDENHQEEKKWTAEHVGELGWMAVA